jgi:hypothetical protein
MKLERRALRVYLFNYWKCEKTPFWELLSYSLVVPIH